MTTHAFRARVHAGHRESVDTVPLPEGSEVTVLVSIPKAAEIGSSSAKAQPKWPSRPGKVLTGLRREDFNREDFERICGLEVLTP